MAHEITLIHEKCCEPPPKSLVLDFKPQGGKHGHNFIDRIEFIAVPSNGHPDSDRYMNINVYPYVEGKQSFALDDRASLKIGTGDLNKFMDGLKAIARRVKTGKLGSGCCCGGC